MTVEDAFTDPPGELSLQYSATYARSHVAGATDLLEQGPTIKLGAMQGVQVSLNPNYNSGTSSERNSGNVLGDVLLQANEQTRMLPAFAVDLFYAPPFGAGYKSAAYVVRGIASKSLGEGENSPRLHINVSDTHLTQPERGGRRDQVQLVIGASFLLTGQDAIVADVVHGPSAHVRQDETFVEVGYSRDLPDDWTLQLGIGKQVDGPANAIRVFFAVEKQLQIF